MDNAAQIPCDDTLRHTSSHHYLVLSAAVIISAYLGRNDFESNFLLSALASVVGVGASVRLMKRCCMKRVATLLACIVLVLINITTCTYQTHRLEHRIEPVIAALAQYQTRHGRYPPSLDALVPDYLSDIPPCPQPRRLGYGQLDDSRYILFCPTYGFNTHIYDSSTRQWEDVD